ncbi:hypothetical protein [Salinithrix halophila]|uniref:PH domain-containing protein n=1 Tax=Salinithrix halophila TaxID=1485204 RepID=A0ABV8JGM8_9BACL
MIRKWVGHLKKWWGNEERHSSSYREEPEAAPEKIEQWKREAEELIERYPDSTVFKGEGMELAVRKEGFVIRPRAQGQQSDVWRKHSTHWRNFWLYDTEEEIDFRRLEKVTLRWEEKHPEGSLELRYRGEDQDRAIPFRSWPQFFALREAQKALESRSQRGKKG